QLHLGSGEARARRRDRGADARDAAHDLDIFEAIAREDRGAVADAQLEVADRRRADAIDARDQRPVGQRALALAQCKLVGRAIEGRADGGVERDRPIGPRKLGGTGIGHRYLAALRPLFLDGALLREVLRLPGKRKTRSALSRISIAMASGRISSALISSTARS